MNIYVGNLSWQMTDEDLRNLFEQHGTVASAKIVKDKVSGRSKGFGFVEMEDDGEAQQAITNLYDSEVMGRRSSLTNRSLNNKAAPVAGGGFTKKKELRRWRRRTEVTKKVAMTVAAVVVATTGIINLINRYIFVIKILSAVFRKDFFISIRVC